MIELNKNDNIEVILNNNRKYECNYFVNAGGTFSDKIANMYKWSSTTGTSAFTAAEFSTGGEIQFGGTYITDN